MRVDYLVVSHPDLDHFGGMAFIARNFAPREFWAPNAIKPEPTYTALLAEVAAKHVRVRFVDSSMRPLRVGSASVRCLSPVPGEVERKDNNLSLVLRINDGRQSALFTGDIETAGERAMLAREPRSEFSATVLKAPHHGSRTSSSPQLIAAVHPTIVVLSLGRHNIFGFPAPEVVDRRILREIHADRAVLRTRATYDGHDSSFASADPSSPTSKVCQVPSPIAGSISPVLGIGRESIRSRADFSRPAAA